MTIAVLHNFCGGADPIAPQQAAAVPWNATFIRHAMERSRLARTSVLNPQLVRCLLTVLDVLERQPLLLGVAELCSQFVLRWNFILESLN